MFARMFNHTNLMQKSLDVMALRQEVIAHNIANADTPNYKVQHVEFESLYRQALQDRANGAVQLKTSSPRHIQSDFANPEKVSPAVVSETWHTMRMDGSNVDVDQEMTELAMNTIRYQLTLQQVSEELKRLKTAITG
ncbi:MAG: flagellar basal body rod protein FlgB [Oscillospiraceae bacterium]|nr:flagellar basal body rod protein FlgB [Oscillospiraceae bacterium]